MSEKSSRGVSSIAIPLLTDPPMLIEAPFPLSEDEWDYAMNVLRMMRPGLVQPQATDSTIPLGEVGMVDDGFGGSWALCGPSCDLQVVRPGRAQCNRTDAACYDTQVSGGSIVPPETGGTAR